MEIGMKKKPVHVMTVKERRTRGGGEREEND